MRTDATDEPVKVGGQALADGVLMRTSRAWAIARADGSVEVGALAPNPFAGVPVLRIVAALFSALKLGVVRGMLGRGPAARQARPVARQARSAEPPAGPTPDAHRTGSRRLNQRLLVILVALEAAAYLGTRQFGDVPVTGVTGAVVMAVTCAVTFVVLRLATPRSLWRYHGAEHKAVAAHEQGLDLADTAAVLRAPRVHDRCGTNLVFLVLLAGYALKTTLTGWLQVPGILLLIGVAAEVATMAAKRPDTLASRVLLGGGKALQRWVTTAEPTPAEQRVGCAALTACLEEHARVLAAESAQTAPADPADPPQTPAEPADTPAPALAVA